MADEQVRHQDLTGQSCHLAHAAPLSLWGNFIATVVIAGESGMQCFMLDLQRLIISLLSYPIMLNQEGLIWVSCWEDKRSILIP